MLHVAFAADEAYVPHGAAMLHSLITRQGGRVSVHFLHAPALGGDALTSLAAMVTRLGADWHAHAIPDHAVAALPAMGRISRVMWYRIFLPELLPEVARILYLDCDIIVLKDLAPLYGLDLRGCALAAVRNVFERRWHDRPAELGLEPTQYFNSGVLLMDLDIWRREKLADRVMSCVREHADRLIWPDQDALNITLAGRWLAIHPRWNCQNSLFYFRHAADVLGAEIVEEAVSDPVIVHFEGGELAKPWHFLSKNPYRPAYFEHRAATPWPIFQLEGRTPINRVLRMLPMRWLPPALGLKLRLERFWRKAQRRLLRTRAKEGR